MKRLLLFAALLLVSHSSLGNENIHISDKERDKVLSALENNERWRALAKNRKPVAQGNVDDRRVLAQTRAYIVDKGDGKGRFVQTMQYIYQGGVTIRSTINLDTMEIIDVERLEAYPTPLVDAEKLRAVRIARSSEKSVEAMLTRLSDRVRIEALSPVIADRTDPRFGHRIVYLRFVSGSSDQPVAVRAEIDLTTGKVINPIALNNIAPLLQPLQGELTQEFPSGAAKTETAWKISWGIERHAGGSEVLFIKEAHFRTSAEADWLKVLGDCRLAEIFVPYNGGTRIYDISGFNFSLATLSLNDLGPECVGPGEIFEQRVAKELHDNHLLWMNDFGQSKRMEELHLWSVLDAGNYRYIILYVFRMDGSIAMRLGATAHNLFDSPEDRATHLHASCWRLNVALGNASGNDIQHVRYRSTISHPNPSTVVDAFNGGVEGGIEWNPSEFTRLRIQSKTIKNSHQPKNLIGYELVPIRIGNARLFGIGEEFTHSDIWVTRASAHSEMNYRDLPQYVSNQESISDVENVIWHLCPLVHRPRDEDFGSMGYGSEEGSALTAWGGFELTPRNLFNSTPLYP